jgi:hypothetical protein
VRAYAEAEVTPGYAEVMRDFEAPIGVPLTYTVTTWAAATPATTDSGQASITIADGGCEDTWLGDLARPTNTQKVVLESLAELDYAIEVGIHNIIARRSPIISSDVADTPSFELNVLTDSDDARERTRAALGNGVPVLLRTPPANGIGNLYFAVTGFREQRIVNAARVQDRRFVVSAVQIERPDPSLYSPTPPQTYAGLEQSFATYADLKAGRASYDAALWDYSEAGAEDVVSWPPSDV